jgi:hypothetical protein
LIDIISLVAEKEIQLPATAEPEESHLQNVSGFAASIISYCVYRKINMARALIITTSLFSLYGLKVQRDSLLWWSLVLYPIGDTSRVLLLRLLSFSILMLSFCRPGWYITDEGTLPVSMLWAGWGIFSIRLHKMHLLRNLRRKFSWKIFK